MKQTILTVLILIASITIHAKEKLNPADEAAIRSVMKKQEVSWNKGDLNTFMETYWNSPDLVFVGASGPTYGWQQTMDRYKERYPSVEAMGQTHFKLLDLYSIDTNTAFVIGRFHLVRKIGDVKGSFTLVLQKIEGQWLIISDHSSAEN